MNIEAPTLHIRGRWQQAKIENIMKTTNFILFLLFPIILFHKSLI